MAVRNSLTARPVDKTIKYEANGKEVSLSLETVKKYLVSGDASAVTNEELVMFINLCKFNQLNPWLKEAYLIKYGNQPATLVTGKEAFMKRAEAHAQYDGFEAGIIVLSEDKIVYRTGTVKLDYEQIIGGWAEVWRKDRSHATRTEVSFTEYAGRKKDGTLNSQWATKPATMIRKVALVQALREAFPATFGAMYAAEEQGVSEEETAVNVSEEMQIEQPVVAAEEPSDDSLI